MAASTVAADETRATRLSGPRGQRRAWLLCVLHHPARLADWLFGAAALIVGLSVLATIPIVQLASLGYLLEASGRVVRSGHVGDGFVGVRQAAQLGRIALGVMLLLIPLWIASSLRFSAVLIDPESRAAFGWTVAVGMIAALVTFQIVTGCLRGAKLRHFLVPRPVLGLRVLCRADSYARRATGCGISSSDCGCRITSGWGCGGLSGRHCGWSCR